MWTGQSVESYGRQSSWKRSNSRYRIRHESWRSLTKSFWAVQNVLNVNRWCIVNILATIVNKIIDKEDYLMLLRTSELHLNHRAKFHEDFYCELWADSPIKRSLNKSFWSWVMVTTLLIFYMDRISNVTYYSWNKLFKENHLLLPWYDL